MISVLIPTRSNADGLRRALRSLRAQRGADWEAIVIDDGAGEGLAVAKAFGDGRIRAHRNPHHGLIAARNAGLEVARGAVIAWLSDTDEWSDAHHLSRICQALRHGEALSYCGGWLRRAYDDLEPQVYAPSVTVESLRHTNPLLQSGIAYPAVMHDWFGDFDLSLGLTWDWDWYLRVTNSGVPLRRIEGSHVSVLQPDVRPNPARWSRDLALLGDKHGLQHITSFEQSTMLELIATD